MHGIKGTYLQEFLKFESDHVRISIRFEGNVYWILHACKV